jgi:transcriptional regulator with XRE-family HTH domain
MTVPDHSIQSLDPMPNELAQQLRQLRALRDKSLREVEKETGISNAYLSQLERGKSENPSPHKLHKLADYYDVPYNTLMRAAGYIEESDQEKTPSAVESALMSLDLDDDEMELVVDFVNNVLRKRKGDG